VLKAAQTFSRQTKFYYFLTYEPLVSGYFLTYSRLLLRYSNVLHGCQCQTMVERLRESLCVLAMQALVLLSKASYFYRRLFRLTDEKG
jgi:hypothetical protein